MTSSNPLDSKDRILLNGKGTVPILYQLCFGLSQKCNLSQEDNGFFLQFCNLSQTGIETQQLLLFKQGITWISCKHWQRTHSVGSDI